MSWIVGMNFSTLGQTASQQHGLVSWGQLVEVLGPEAATRMTRQGFVERVLPGVYRVAGHSPTFLQQARAAVLAVPGSVASHLTAAHLWGLLPFRDERIDLSVASDRRVRIAGIHIYRSQTLPGPNPVREGIPVTTPARTLLDIGVRCRPHHVTMAVESALHDRLVTLTGLERELERFGGRGRRGCATLRSLLKQYEPGDDQCTPLERKVLQGIRRIGLPEPKKQYRVRLDGRDRFFDFAYPHVHLAIEAHSGEWHNRLTKFERDWDRLDSATEAGWTSVHITAALLEQGLARAKRLYEARAADPAAGIARPDGDAA